MLTPGEIGAINDALTDLAASVEAMRAAYTKSRNLLSYVFVEDEATTYAREAYEARRDLYTNAVDRRRQLVEDPAEQHEEALAFVESVRAIVRDGLPNLITANARNSDVLAVGGDVVKGTLATLTTPSLWPTWAKGLATLAVIAVVVAVVVPVLGTWSALRGGRR
jgi:hypothetical protein